MIYGVSIFSILLHLSWCWLITPAAALKIILFRKECKVKQCSSHSSSIGEREISVSSISPTHQDYDIKHPKIFPRTAMTLASAAYNRTSNYHLGCAPYRGQQQQQCSIDHPAVPNRVCVTIIITSSSYKHKWNPNQNAVNDGVLGR